MTENLGQIGEREILNRLKKFMPLGQIEDDTAHIKNVDPSILINTDVLVEGVHFSQETTSAKDIGWRAIAANLSDLASSGVDQILGVTVGLIAPPTTDWEWVEDVYIGITAALKRFGGIVLGGDCSSGKEKVVAITALGTAGKLRLHRSNALAGDLLVASGSHGLSRLGLALLLEEPNTKNMKISERLKKLAIQTHQRPIPPLETLKSLTRCKPKEVPWRAAGTDSSDGLLNAVQNICISSNCQALLDKKKLPKDSQWPQDPNWEKWCLNGGEDFELILSLPPSWAKALNKTLPTCKIIGYIKNGPPQILWNDGKQIENLNYLEFKHF